MIPDAKINKNAGFYVIPSGKISPRSKMLLQTALYLIPVEISEAPAEDVIPAGNIEVVRQLRHFIVENLRTARRTLRRWDRAFPIDDCEFFELNGHTPPESVGACLDPLRRGIPMGVMSEAGCPAVADPGADVVARAQSEGLRVIPMVGPSSILMALMGSGFNGQGFAFNGYLPIREDERVRAVKELEQRSATRGETQIFIETPYRNNNMVAFLARHLRPETRLCVACGITDPRCESIITLKASEWRSRKYDYARRPAIFLIHV